MYDRGGKNAAESHSAANHKCNSIEENSGMCLMGFMADCLQPSHLAGNYTNTKNQQQLDGGRGVAGGEGGRGS